MNSASLAIELATKIVVLITTIIGLIIVIAKVGKGSLPKMPSLGAFEPVVQLIGVFSFMLVIPAFVAIFGWLVRLPSTFDREPEVPSYQAPSLTSADSMSTRFDAMVFAATQLSSTSMRDSVLGVAVTEASRDGEWLAAERAARAVASRFARDSVLELVAARAADAGAWGPASRVAASVTGGATKQRVALALARKAARARDSFVRRDSVVQTP